MNDIIDLANRLGRAINDSPQAVTLRAAREEMNTHAEVTQLLKDFQTQADKIAKLEAEKKPIEVEDKHRLQDLQDKLVASETFKKFTAAQVEYVDLMRRVNGALREHIEQTEKD